MRSLSRTLVLGTMVGTAAVVLMAGMLLYLLVRASLVDQFDQAMIDKARLLASTVEQDQGKLDLEFQELDIREFQVQHRPAYLQLWLADGSPLFRSPSLGEGQLERTVAPIESPVCRKLTLPDGRAGRAVSITFRPRGENPVQRRTGAGETPGHSSKPDRSTGAVTLMLARETRWIDDTLIRLEALLLLVGLITIAVSAAVLWLVIRRSLRPLNRLAVEIGRLGEEDLSKRLDVQQRPQELEPVVNRLNDFLCRLQGALQRERSFSANVAHELRTPLAGLRLKLDVTMSKMRQPCEYQEAIAACRQITRQMQTMVENLLWLVRLEAGHVQSKFQPVWLNELVRQAWKPLEGSADSRGLRVQWAVGPEIRLITDPSQLGVVISNILENAVAHADEGGLLRIRTAAEDNTARISVSNTGSALSQDQVEQAFERFWRGDTARSDVGTHCGLGLSLVKKTLAILGGSVAVRSTQGGEFEITVSIPTEQHGSSSGPSIEN